MLENFPALVPQKVCLSCDGCCRYKEPNSIWRPKITSDEINQLRSRRSSLVDKIFSKANVASKGFLKAVPHNKRICKCTFFNFDSNTCSIYGDRPFECQLYPFILNKRKHELVISVHLSCPYAQEKRYTPLFEGYVVSLKAFFARPEIKKFLKENPVLFNDYSDYDDEIEDIFTLNL